MMRIRDLLTGLGAGAGLMYLMDPRVGRRRRALLRDRAAAAVRQLYEELGTMLRDTEHRLEGLWFRVQGLAVREEELPEAKMAARVRSRLGRHVSHPSAVEVRVERDRVILSGPVLAAEVDPLLRATASVRGVRAVENRLDVHREADIPALQPGESESEPSSRQFSRWAPATRLAASAAGTVLMVRCARDPGPINVLLGTLGFGLFLRAAANEDLGSLLFLGGRGGIDLEKTIRIGAPVEQVWAFWTRYDQFPRFLTNVREVEDLGHGRSRWSVRGPMGSLVRFDAVETERASHEVLAWRSDPGSPVTHMGRVRFESLPDGATRVHLRMSYQPPAGLAGHAIASLVGKDPESQFHDDLLRMKTFLETGTAPHDAAQPQEQKTTVASGRTS